MHVCACGTAIRDLRPRLHRAQSRLAEKAAKTRSTFCMERKCVECGEKLLSHFCLCNEHREGETRGSAETKTVGPQTISAPRKLIPARRLLVFKKKRGHSSSKRSGFSLVRRTSSEPNPVTTRLLGHLHLHTVRPVSVYRVTPSLFIDDERNESNETPRSPRRLERLIVPYGCIPGDCDRIDELR